VDDDRYSDADGWQTKGTVKGVSGQLSVKSTMRWTGKRVRQGEEEIARVFHRQSRAIVEVGMPVAAMVRYCCRAVR
jgi:hypothetical protein